MHAEKSLASISGRSDEGPVFSIKKRLWEICDYIMSLLRPSIPIPSRLKNFFLGFLDDRGRGNYINNYYKLVGTAIVNLCSNYGIFFRES